MEDTTDATTADETDTATEVQKQLHDAMSYQGTKEEKQVRAYLATLGIDYDELTPEEVVMQINILKKSKHFSNYELANYGADGTFIDLTPYITPEVMPNLTAMLEAHPEIRAAITMSDGKIYGLPSGEQMGTAGIGKPVDQTCFSLALAGWFWAMTPARGWGT